MTFSQNVKEELCRNEYDDVQKKSILCAFFKNNPNLKISDSSLEIDIKSKSSLTIRFILNLLDFLYKDNDLIEYKRERSKNDLKFFHFSFSKGLDILLEDLHLNKDPYKWLVETKTRSCFLIGLFLYGGSINSPNSSNYHFEIKIHNTEILKIVEKIFSSINIPLLVLNRNNTYIVYIKKSESISDILKLLGATESMFEYEEKRISRDYTNQMSRLNNLDMSNLKKTIEASHIQLQNIEYVKNNNLFNQLTDKEKIYCELRESFPDSSLHDLVDLYKEKYNIEITRGGINHIIRKIKRLSE
ncbi:DNA-binding protein WhiA [Malacoplasma penetrans]|uniref:Probable cell division protein WhiA n=1 Tax=Malacoplasma penetrans (strain HF-2) TaxID=272633 RepID=Q8EWM2_MALP2|nr:DNA-binding protein WhiA [Malacoplasma penetrans]RXY96349.1 DNA-binding protein WhiA [Malacoplasma penetrans]BAC43972.1 conserved hypothetical protein [Malacoplasma penetrans HF-2]